MGHLLARGNFISRRDPSWSRNGIFAYKNPKEGGAAPLRLAVPPAHRLQSVMVQQRCCVLRTAASLTPIVLHPQCCGSSVAQIGGGTMIAASVNAAIAKITYCNLSKEWASKPNKLRMVQHLLAVRRSQLSSLSAVLTAHRQRKGRHGPSSRRLVLTGSGFCCVTGRCGPADSLLAKPRYHRGREEQDRLESSCQCCSEQLCEAFIYLPPKQHKNGSLSAAGISARGNMCITLNTGLSDSGPAQ